MSKSCTELLFICVLVLLRAIYSSQETNVVNLEVELEDKWYVSEDQLYDFTFIPQIEESKEFVLDAQFVLKNTRFLLWTRNNPIHYKELKTGNKTRLVVSEFKKDIATKIFVHGFQQNGHHHHRVEDLRNEYLKRENCNFISVDWEYLAIFPFYVRAVIHTNAVGELTGRFINFLVEQGADLRKFHIIGFSLGAHAAGKAGAVINGLLPRITGLDPAFPMFSMIKTEQRLDKSDAQFVDVIHTNSGKLRQAALSFPMAIGHADFFVNGGHYQPGCGFIASGGIYDLLDACSHTRAPEYFTESINSPVGFKAVPCKSWASFMRGSCSKNGYTFMGDPTSQLARGVFYLTTNSFSPFAISKTNRKQTIDSTIS